MTDALDGPDVLDGGNGADGLGDLGLLAAHDGVGHRARLDAFIAAANSLAATIGRTTELAEDAADVLRLSRDGNAAIWGPTNPRFVSLADAAERTGRHPDVLRRWCAQGTIPAIRVGRTWALSRETVAELASHAGRSRPRLTRIAPGQSSIRRNVRTP